MEGVLLKNEEYKKGAIYRFEIKDDGTASLTTVGQNGKSGLQVFGYITPKARII